MKGAEQRARQQRKRIIALVRLGLSGTSQSSRRSAHVIAVGRAAAWTMERRRGPSTVERATNGQDGDVVRGLVGADERGHHSMQNNRGMPDADRVT